MLPTLQFYKAMHNAVIESYMEKFILSVLDAQTYIFISNVAPQIIFCSNINDYIHETASDSNASLKSKATIHDTHHVVDKRPRGEVKFCGNPSCKANALSKTIIIIARGD